MKKFGVLFVSIVLFLTGFGVLNVSAQKKIKKKAVVQKKNNWYGMWSVPSRFYGSTLTVNNVTATRFKFDLQAFNGANEGAISGVAEIKGAKAFFDDRNSIEKDAPKEGCRLTFTHKGEFIEIEQTSECGYYAGNAVTFEGKYQKNVMTVEESDFVVLDVFPDKTLDAKFKALVGKDYEKFLDSFHLITEQENLDTFGAKVFSACVRGVCPWNAGIIMYDETGSLWAAVIEADDADKASVRYYTNVSEWSDKLPKTIEAWVAGKREMNDNLTVIFK